MGASKDSLNKQGGTPEDLWSRTHLTNDHQINFWNEERQEVEQIDVTEFKHLTGARFVESLKVSPTKLTEGWLNGFKVADQVSLSSSISSLIEAGYRQIKQQDRVYLKKMPANMGLGL